MIKKLIHQPLAIFDSIVKKNRFKEQCHNDMCTFRYIMPCDRFTPFVLLREPYPGPITTITLHCYDDGTTTDMTGQLSFYYHSIILDGMPMDEIQMYGNLLAAGLPCGLHYLELTDGVNTWYTEDFQIECFTDVTDLDGAVLYATDKILINDSGDALKFTE